MILSNFNPALSQILTDYSTIDWSFNFSAHHQVNLTTRFPQLINLKLLVHCTGIFVDFQNFITIYVSLKTLRDYHTF